MLFKRLLQNGVPHDMTEFSNLFSKFILSKNISVYSLAKYCNLDRSTIYKIRKGERNPSSPELVEKFSEFLHLTPQEHQCLMEAYEITLVGTDTYYRRKSIRDFLMQFPNSFTLRPSDNPGHKWPFPWINCFWYRFSLSQFTEPVRYQSDPGKNFFIWDQQGKWRDISPTPTGNILLFLICWKTWISRIP